MKMRELTPEEERVIVHKGTEPPFSGIFNDHFAPGYYLCRRCGRALFRASDKFRAGCGWPSFDDEIAGAVRRQTDADGHRTEILCAGCNAHLGHVFTGEKLTGKDIRHCVNSLALDFLSADATARAVFAGGCFWGVEYYLRRMPGAITTRTGYTGGRMEHPDYRQVCEGSTGHAEAVEVFFDPRRVTFEQLARCFFEIHDPTQVDRQGPDVGTQYRSAVFFTDDDQHDTAGRLVEQLRRRGYDVATEILPAGPFWPAEDYHQQYYDRHGNLPYCHAPVKRFDRAATALRKG